MALKSGAEQLERELAGGVHIANAGLVIASVYLPRLFSTLDLTEDSAFKSPRTAEGAVHLLHFLGYGATHPPEHELVLNKVLCGIPLGVPVARDIPPADHEREVVESLIAGIIQNWSVLGNTTVDGLRESFIKRDGALAYRDEAWRLSVQPKAYDMLLDRLPWIYATIRHPWMKRVLHVDWR